MFKFEPGAFYTHALSLRTPSLEGFGRVRGGHHHRPHVSHRPETSGPIHPPPFEVGQEPLITVYYGMNRQIEWLAGGSYNILGVDASVFFKGKVDQLAGNYCLVLWENLTDPILPRPGDAGDPQDLRGDSRSYHP